MKKKCAHMACPDCAARVVVKINDHGTLSYTGDECDSASYCKQGAGNRAAWEKKITPVEKHAPAAPQLTPAQEWAQVPVIFGRILGRFYPEVNDIYGAARSGAAQWCRSRRATAGRQASCSRGWGRGRVKAAREKAVKVEPKPDDPQQSAQQ